MLYHPDAASYQAAWAGYVEKADAQLKELEPLGKALSDTIDSLGKRETFESTPDAATTLKAAVMGAAKARLIAIESHVDRVMLGVMMLAQADAADSVTEQTLKLQKEFVGDVVHLRKAADLLLDARVAPHPQEVAWLEGYVMALERHARDHLMEATRHLPPDQDLSASPVGKAALELAASIRLLASEIGKVLTAQKLSPQMAARVHDLTVEGRSTQVQEPPIEEAEPALSAQESAVSEGPSNPAASTAATPRLAFCGRPIDSIGRKAGIVRGARGHHRTGDGAAPAVSQAATADGRGAIRLFALAESMNRDVSRIRTAMDTGIDPIHVAQSMRNALVSWFGQPGIWAQRSQQLDSMAGPVMEEPSMARLRDDVAQRTAAVQALHDQVRQIEIDLIKQYAYPMARHVSMLLASGEAMPEGAVSKLRSEGDPDDTHGKVFEVRLAGRPLSDGQPAPSLYVHFHTEKVVDTGAIATISPRTWRRCTSRRPSNVGGARTGKASTPRYSALCTGGL